MIRRLSLAFALLVSATLHAQEQPVSRALVPVVGSVTGVGGVQWRTDIRIHNPFKQDLEIVLTLPSAAGEPFLFTTVPAGETIWFYNVVRDAFGLDGMLSPLVIQTLHDQPVTVVATITGDGPDGPVKTQSEPTVYTRSFAARGVLHSLAHDEERRTNVGLVNLGETVSTFTLALERVSGRNFATKEISIGPGALVQLPLSSLFPVLTKGEDLMLVVEVGNDQSYVYASVVDNETHAGTFVGP